MGTQTFSPLPVSDPRILPQPPRLHWGWVLALSAITRSLFGSVWLVVQANWIRRLTGNGRPMGWAIANLCAVPLIFISAIAFGVVAGIRGITWDRNAQSVAGMLVGLLVIALYVVANFQVRAELQAKPIELPLGGIMTFFFGPIYFQYLLHDYVLPDAIDVLGPIPAAPAYVPVTLPGEPQR